MIGSLDFPAHIAESRARHLSPGIGAVWVGPNGSIETTAHGRRTAREGAIARPDHLWHIGSCTKAMTATIIARLVERGLIQFDTPLAEALPQLASAMSAGFRTTPLSDVLTHRAGLARDPADTTFRALRRSSASASAQRLFLARQTLASDPRPQVGYSNLGYIVIGAVIEHLTSQTWEAALAREVMIPLGIGRFGVGPPGSAQPSGHVRLLDHWVPSRADNPIAYGPAGRVHLALDEWGRFLRAHLGTGSYLTPETLKSLHTAGENGIAMGWIKTEDQRSGQTRLHHTGSNTAWYAQAVLLPDLGIGVGIVCNAYDKRIAKAVGDLSDDLLGHRESNAP